MRRILCLLSVVLVLCACALPAFALGEDYGSERYASMPFDGFIVSGYGGPIDFVGAHSRVGTNLNFTMNGFPNNRIVDGTISCTNSSIETYYTVDFVPATGATSTTAIALIVSDKLLMPNKNGTKIQFYADAMDNTEFIVTSIDVAGSYYTMNWTDRDDVPTSGLTTFSAKLYKTYQDAEYIDIAQVLQDALPLLAFKQFGIFFHELKVQFNVQRANGSSDVRVHVQSTPHGTYTEPLFASGWINEEIDLLIPPDRDPITFDVGAFLGDSVNSFLNAELFDGFSFGSLLGIAFALGVLFFALKMLI